MLTVANNFKAKVKSKKAKVKTIEMEDWKDYEDIFEPFEKLVEIEINGNSVKVPENNMLLRCFQFLSMETISFGDFCWNGDCANCQIWLEIEGNEKPALSCRTKVEEGMKIIRTSREISLGNSGEI